MKRNFDWKWNWFARLEISYAIVSVLFRLYKHTVSITILSQSTFLLHLYRFLMWKPLSLDFCILSKMDELMFACLSSIATHRSQVCLDLKDITMSLNKPLDFKRCTKFYIFKFLLLCFETKNLDVFSSYLSLVKNWLQIMLCWFQANPKEEDQSLNALPKNMPKIKGKQP